MASHASPPVACLTLLRIPAGSAVLLPAGSAGAAFVAARPAIARARKSVIPLCRSIGSPPCMCRDAPEYSEPRDTVEDAIFFINALRTPSRKFQQATPASIAGTVRVGRFLRRLRGAHIVEVELLPLQVDVEPVENVLQALDAMPGAARAGQLVRLAGEADHDDWAVQVLERAEQLFAACGRRCPVVRLALDEHQRGLDLGDVAQRRAGAEIVRLLPGRAAEPGRLEQGEVGGVPPGRPVGDGALRHGRGETAGVP